MSYSTYRADGGDAVNAAHSAGSKAALLFAERENIRAIRYKQLLKQTEDELLRTHSELLEMKVTIAASESDRKRARDECTIAEERRAIQVCTLDAELAIHREDADIQRRRAETAERFQSRLEIGIKNVVHAIAGVAIPSADIERIIGPDPPESNLSDHDADYEGIKSIKRPLRRVVGSRGSALGALRRELGNARATAQAALRHLHVARATSAAAKRRTEIAIMDTKAAVDRAEAARDFADAMVTKITSLEQEAVCGFVVQNTIASAFAASDAAAAGRAASDAACQFALARAADAERASKTSNAAFAAAMVANRKARSMMVNMQHSNAGDIAVAVAAQSSSAATAASVQSHFAVATAGAAASEYVRSHTYAQCMKRAEARVEVADYNATTLATLAEAHTVSAQEAINLSVLCVKRVVLAEVALNTSRHSHDCAIADAATRLKIFCLEPKRNEAVKMPILSVEKRAVPHALASSTTFQQRSAAGVSNSPRESAAGMTSTICNCTLP